ncbi:MAG TPA: hypothetical protein PLV51_08895, partial [Lentimicrobium sp.]|nr:hypothetical protein [Lentimicrobium sp.]
MDCYNAKPTRTGGFRIAEFLKPDSGYVKNFLTNHQGHFGKRYFLCIRYMEKRIEKIYRVKYFAR